MASKSNIRMHDRVQKSHAAAGRLASYVPPPATEPPGRAVTPLEASLSSLHGAVIEATEDVRGLVESLYTVLQPEAQNAASAGTGGTDPAVTQSPALDAISNIRAQVEYLGAYARAARERVEA